MAKDKDRDGSKEPKGPPEPDFLSPADLEARIKERGTPEYKQRAFATKLGNELKGKFKPLRDTEAKAMPSAIELELACTEEEEVAAVAIHGDNDRCEAIKTLKSLGWKVMVGYTGHERVAHGGRKPAKITVKLTK